MAHPVFLFHCAHTPINKTFYSVTSKQNYCTLFNIYLTYSNSIYNILISILMLQSTSIYAVFSFEKITTLLKKAPTFTQVKQYKYNALQIQTIKLKNISGNIKITTHTSQPTIFISATYNSISSNSISSNSIFSNSISSNSLCTQKQNLEPFTINSSIKEDTLFIQPAVPITENKESIDFHLIVPAHTTLFIETDKGSIHTKDTYGMITLATKQGNITCINTHNSLIATIHKKGSINIELANNPIHATTNKGSIHIYDAKDSIYASIQTGKIRIHSISLPNSGYLDLKADTGSIYLYLSKDAYAHLQATTLYGNISSELPITLQAHTTILNEEVWHKVKQDIKGTLGQNNLESTKSISIKNSKGDIKIIDCAHF